jgi:predicted dehydrogenase
MKQPKLAGHAALMRHFRDCIANGAKPAVGADDGVWLMQVIEALYKSVATGKAVEF